MATTAHTISLRALRVFMSSGTGWLQRGRHKDDSGPSGWGQSPAPAPRVPAHGGPCFALPSLA